MADVLAPKLRIALWRLERADLLELEGPHDAVAVGGVDSRGRPRRALLEQRVEGLGARGSSSAFQRSRTPGGGGGRSSSSVSAARR